jgi:diguanylate cyclase (GGDEF)-like protein
MDEGASARLARRLKLPGPFASPRTGILFAVWAALTVVAIVALLFTDLHRASARLDLIGKNFLQHVSDRALVSETAVEGFSAFVASMEEFDHEQAKGYARVLLDRYPFLYMFEVADRVSHDDRDAAEQFLGSRYPGFQIKRFAYDAERTWQAMEPADYYYPLVFQEPLLDGPANVVGLDLHSSDFLKAAMRASFLRGEPVATHPFDLVEGVRGYVLHRSVGHLGRRPPGAFDSGEYALLALQSETLFAGLRAAPARVAVRLFHSAFEHDDPAGDVLSVAAKPVSASAALLLPRHEVEYTLDLASQPLVLRLQWQLGWADLSLPLMAGVLVGSALLLWGVRSYAQRFIGDELAALEYEGKLYELANFDALTGLANRNRLMDFLEAGLARARRHKTQLAVLFIDLDGFKSVNDSYGHATGDLVLVEVAQRLGQHLREDELLARYGGDEFVWVTAGAEQAPDLEGLVARLRAEFSQPFVARRTPVQLGVSVGCAVFPRDGRNIAALFEVADAAMYRQKRQGAAACGNGGGSRDRSDQPIKPPPDVAPQGDA